MRSFAYRDRLAATVLETLELKRLGAVLVICYTIVFGLINVDFRTFC